MTPNDPSTDHISGKAGLLNGILRIWAIAAPSVAVSWLALGPLAAGTAAILAPALIALVQRPPQQPPAGDPKAGIAGLPPTRPAALAALNAAMDAAAQGGLQTAVLAIVLDDAEDIPARHGQAAFDQILRQSAERISGVLRGGDRVVRVGPARFAVILAPVRRADLELLVQLAARIQTAIAQPFSIDAATVYATVSVGFCLQSRSPAPEAEAFLAAAEHAAEAALRNGPGATRAFSVELERAASATTELATDLPGALDSGQIVAHFQPQISTHTGEVTGFELLARWNHPQRGLLGPGDFLHTIEENGLSARLSEVMVYQALTALRRWDAEGMAVPRVAVNFSRSDLSDPRLPERLKWDLDRFDIAPERMVIEILESVMAETDADIIVRNVAALSHLGCPIDLDDFGTGHASIASMRRFRVDRIKVDRSFVTRVDQDAEQRRMLTAILSMAERLGIQTLAEGVESIGEHALLAQLGCDHVQGFAIARPMPFDDTLTWIPRHRAKLSPPREIDRKAG